MTKPTAHNLKQPQEIQLKMSEKGETDIDDESTELKLLWRDDVMVTWLLCQLHDGCTGGQPQAGHVGVTVRRHMKTIETKPSTPTSF